VPRWPISAWMFPKGSPPRSLRRVGCSFAITLDFSICPDKPEGAECFLARSLLDTAVDWARTGTPRPVPVKTLLDLPEGLLVG
jgi:hypothetical protein